MDATRMYECVDCGSPIQGSTAGTVHPCPRCGGQRWSIAVYAENKLTLYHELGAALANENGELIGERIEKTDLNTSASLSANAGQPTEISVNRKTRVGKFKEEGTAAEALARSYNKIHMTNYCVEPKHEEDNEYADRIFISENDNPKRLCVQIRHLDDNMIGNLGRHGLHVGERTELEWIESICSAIDDKAAVDPKLKSETILQLMLPAPLGEGLRGKIESTVFDHQGFREIWISPFHEESFLLDKTLTSTSAPERR